MTDKARTEKAKKRAKEFMDRILDVYTDRDYVEIVGTMGGDVLTFRFYNDGTVGER